MLNQKGSSLSTVAANKAIRLFTYWYMFAVYVLNVTSSSNKGANSVIEQWCSLCDNKWRHNYQGYAVQGFPGWPNPQFLLGWNMRLGNS